jgi:ribosome-binding protein aMBF1 (putative translation factor)
MVKRFAKNIVRGAGTAIDIAPSRKVVCKSCGEFRGRTVKDSIQRDWEAVGRTISNVFESETRRHGKAEK